MVDVVAACDRLQALALIMPPPGLALLMRRELVRAAYPAPLFLGLCPALAGPSADQLAFKLGEARQYRQHEPAV